MSTLETTVEAIIDRVLLMEVAALSGQTPAIVGATKHWYYVPQAYPYWTNRPAALREEEPQHKWRLDIQARLWLAHISQVNTGTPVQTGAWSFIPAVLAYFREHRQLDYTGQAEITYLDAPGASIENLTGLETGALPLVPGTFLFTDFTIQIPILIYEVV
jgi:hypothetical protein